MRLFALVFGSRWFWALLIVAGTLASVELDRRGIAPWQTAVTERVELPSVDLGELGDAVTFDAADDIPPGFDPTATTVRTHHRGHSHGESGFDDGLGEVSGLEDDLNFPAADRVPAPRDPVRDDLGGGFDAGGFGDRGFGDRGFGDRGLRDDDFGDDRFSDTFDDPFGTDDADRGFDSSGFDPLDGVPFRPGSSYEVRTEDLPPPEPLDPAEAYELPLVKVDRNGVPVRPTAGTRPAALVLDVSAPLRLPEHGTATFSVVIRNDGGSAAHNVVLTARLDDGIDLAGRSLRAARKRVGDLPAGATRRLNLELQASTVGRHCVRFAIVGDGSNALEKRICVQVSPATAGRDVTVQ